MKLWIGCEGSSDIAESFREVRNTVVKAVNSVIEASDYGLDLNGWDCIAIVRDDNEFDERTRYSANKRDMDVRLRVDHDQFKSADATMRKSMLIEMLLRSLEILSENWLSNEGLSRLRADVLTVAQRIGLSGES